MTDPATDQDKSLAPGKPKALAVMASRLNVEPQKLLQTLKETVFKGANDSELLTLVVVANEYGLSPLLKEIYAFPAKGGGITPVVSIDGWISMVNRQPQLDGLEFSYDSDGDGNPTACTCTIYIKNRSHPVRVSEFYSECFRATEPWKQMPRRMLRHKALKEAARVAFGFSGITDEDEARDIMKNADAHVVIERKPFPPPRRIEKPELGTQSDEVDAASDEPVAPSKSKSKVKTTAGQETAQDRLYAEVREWLGNDPHVPDKFVADLKLIKFPGIQSDAELISELSEETCEAILAAGMKELTAKIRDHHWLQGTK